MIRTLALILPLTACGAEQVEERVDTSFLASSQQLGFVMPNGMGVVERGGHGPLYLSVKEASPGGYTVNRPSSQWQGCTRSTPALGQVAAMLWQGCRVEGATAGELIDGDFDVWVVFNVLDPDGNTEVDVWLDNRLDGHAIGDLRLIFRVDPQTLGDPDLTYTYFMYDEWTQDPLMHLATANLNPHVHLLQFGWMPEDVANNTGFYRNRIKTKPVLSMHTPAWGTLVTTRDVDNAEPGWLLLGSNSGSLEFGYDFRMPNDRTEHNGGGLIRMGSGLRLAPLPAEAPVEHAWWETAATYRQLIEGSGLLPAEPLAQASFPSTWSHNCVHMGGRWQASTTDAYVDAVRQSAAFYTAGAGDDMIDMCVNVWGWSDHTAPYAAAPGFDELLDKLQALEGELGIGMHVTLYVNPQIVDEQTMPASFQPGIVRDERGNPRCFTSSAGRRECFAFPGYAPIVASLENVLTSYYDKGVHGVYFDAPFAEGTVDYPLLGGPSRVPHWSMRQAVQRIADHLDSLGGGVIAIEQQRLGLNSMQGSFLMSSPLVLQSESVPLSEALYHQEHLGFMNGYILCEPWEIALADESIAPAQPGFEPGGPGNVDHILRLSMEGAVFGRATYHDVRNNAYFNGVPSSAWPTFEQAMFDMVEASRRAVHLRGRVAALRTGNMLPTPAAARSLSSTMYARGGCGTEPRVAKRRVDLVPASYWQDLETAGEHVLVIGNTTGSAETMTYTIDPSDYPTMTASAYRAIDQNGTTLAPSTSGTLTFSAAVAPYDFAVVRVVPQP